MLRCTLRNGYINDRSCTISLVFRIDGMISLFDIEITSNMIARNLIIFPNLFIKFIACYISDIYLLDIHEIVTINLHHITSLTGIDCGNT